MGEEEKAVSQVYVFTSIVFLSLFARIMVCPPYFIDAVYACMSMPVVYTVSHYAQVATAKYKFVKLKKEVEVSYEVFALLSGFFTGIAMFYALTGTLDMAVFTMAFIASQSIRAMCTTIVNVLIKRGFDPMNPLALLPLSAATAFVHALTISILYGLFCVQF